jgi:hypothetical protein
LGSKELDGTRRIDSDYSITNKVEKIEAKHTGYENWTSNKLRTELIPSMTGQ